MENALQQPIGSKVYLSVDIDFWNHFEPKEAQKDLGCILRAISTQKIPYFICQDHAQMLRHISKFPEIDHLVNIDAHSDITDLCSAEKREEISTTGLNEQYSMENSELSFAHLNCGTWVNYVRQRKQAKYTWITCEIGGGNCHLSYDPFKHKDIVEWKDCQIYAADQDTIQKFDYSSVVAVGFALSYEYIESSALPLIRMLHKFSGQSFRGFYKVVKNSKNVQGDFSEQDFDKIDRMYKMKVFYK